MNEITKKINIYSSLSFCIGIILAYFFALAPNLKLYKLLNILGVLFSIIGILIISQYVLKSENLKKFVSDKFTAYALISLSMIPVGMMFGSLGTMLLFILSGIQDISTVFIIVKFAGVILLFVFTPLFIIEYFVDIALPPGSAISINPTSVRLSIQWVNVFFNIPYFSASA